MTGGHYALAVHQLQPLNPGDELDQIQRKTETNGTTLHQPDRRMIRRYNRRDTPSRLYRRVLAHDRMPPWTIPPRHKGSPPGAKQGLAARSEARARRESPQRQRSDSRRRTA
jgi:hypothetical protein